MDSIDWRIWLGMAITFTWISLGALYIVEVIGPQNFLYMPADRLGNFLEGAFAPLAFLWLVIGYFLQKQELASNTLALRQQLEEIQRSAEQAEIQSKVIAANELHARQETFLRVANQVNGQLGTIVGFLFISSQGATGNGNVSAEEQSRLFARISQSDSDVFSRRLLEVHILADEAERFALFYGTPIRARHSNHFIEVFERLMARAAESDPDGLLRSALHDNSHGLVYRLAIGHRKNAPKDLADAKSTGTFISF